MVTAGVYLIVRSNAIFDLTNTAVTLVLIVGVVTMLLGAIIACAKDDIKKSLAGSTMSQIGYMFLAAGLGPAGYVFAIFHLLMHGMFKADLFLSAGSVIHGMRDEQDMRRFGALRAVMLVTTACFIAGFLGISGIPPFDSFFSKDDIIAAAMGTNVLAGICALVAAGITAFYMTRMVVMTFFGKARWDADQDPHESPAVMTVPMILLSIGALFGGLWFVLVMPIEEWLAPVTGFTEAVLPIPHIVLELTSIVVVAVGILLAWRMYGMQEVPRTAPANVSPLTVAARNQMYDDAFNEMVFMRPGQYLTRWLVWFDNRGVDGAVKAIAAGMAGAGNLARRTQTGFARSYALTMVGGAVLVGAIFVAARWV
jgi:NADH-quinone oxidoreductase subunit L